MRLGFVSREWDDALLAAAARLGIQSVELMSIPGTDCDLLARRGVALRRARDALARHGLCASSLFVLANHLSPKVAERKRAADTMMKAIKGARELGTTIVTANSGGDRTRLPVDQIGDFKKVWRRYARAAEDAGVRIAMENWPNGGGDYPTTIGNIACGPQMWQRLFDAVPSKAIGLEYDPSHLIWQSMDPVAPITEFGDRIYIFHAKDTEIMHDRLARSGFLITGAGERWWRFRIPGWGQADWTAIMAALADTGFDGDVVIEHEDPVFSGTREKFLKGLDAGARFLHRFLV